MAPRTLRARPFLGSVLGAATHDPAPHILSIGDGFEMIGSTAVSEPTAAFLNVVDCHLRRDRSDR